MDQIQGKYDTQKKLNSKNQTSLTRGYPLDNDLILMVNPSWSQGTVTAILASRAYVFLRRTRRPFFPSPRPRRTISLLSVAQSVVLHFTRLYPRQEENCSTGHRLARRTETINLTHDTESRGVNLLRGKLTYPCLIGVRLKEPPQPLFTFSRFKIQKILDKAGSS